MNRYLKITITTLTTWLLSAMINGFVCGIFITIVNNHPTNWPVYVIAVFFFSMIFSAPGFFIFWIVLIITFTKWIQGRALFRTALSAGFLLSFVTAIICSRIFQDEFPANNYVLILFAVMSSIASIMIHFNHFKSITKRNETNAI